MTNSRGYDNPGTYEIRFRRRPGEGSFPWFRDYEITFLGGGETLLTAPVPDQAALHGLLCTLRDLGLPLISITKVQDGNPPKEGKPVGAAALEKEAAGSSQKMVKTLALLSIFGLFLVFYMLVLRPWHLHWGATEEEIMRPMPGDEIVPDPSWSATRAVTIQATPEEIWPWIEQIGDERAGFYGYDWFDNRFKRSAERILPAFQDLKAGDIVPISRVTYQIVESMDPPRTMVWKGNENPTAGTWAWGLYPIDAESTRLVTRMRGKHNWSTSRIALDLFVEWGDLAFMRKCMLGIKQRAEGTITDTFIEDLAEGGLWFGALGIFIYAIALVFRQREGWWKPWTLALGTAATFTLVFYVRPPVWVGAGLELAILAGLMRVRGKSAREGTA